MLDPGATYWLITITGQTARDAMQRRSTKYIAQAP